MILLLNVTLSFNNRTENPSKLINVDLLPDMVFEDLVPHVGC